MTPLQQAHNSGSRAWPRDRKEKSANFPSDPDHLIAVTGSANRSKASLGPDQ